MASVCKSCSNTKCQMYGEAFMKTCKEYVPMGVEERADQYSKIYEHCSGYKSIKKAYIAGYNDALEKIKDIKADYEVYKKSLSNGIIWHKVADGELPKNKGMFLFRDKDEKETRYINYGITDDIDFVKEFYEWTELPRYEGE